MKITDGCLACASMSYKLSDSSFIYPITPSSPMASEMEILSNKNTKNIFGDTVNISQMQSEGGAAGALHGALITGSLASTFTSSQGLLLMLPNMYKIAGERLPGVIHVASRSIATHALSIFGDHQDVYAARQTGFSILASTNVQDAYNLALVSHLSAIDASMPFMHFFDGFRTSHEVNQISEISDSKIKQLVNKPKIEEFRKRTLNSGKSITMGTAQNEDVYFQMMEAKNIYYEDIPDIVNENMKKVNKLTNQNYRPFNYYGSPTAKYVIVAMGSVCDTIKEVLKYINKEDNNYGLIEVHLYRPFSKKYLDKALPKTALKIAVLDRTKEHGSAGEPLYLDILSSVSDRDVKVYGGRYGLSSKNTTPSDIYDVYMSLINKPKHNFTIGIVDDLTNTSLKKYPYKYKNEFKEMVVYGFGSDGMVGASRDLLTILGKDKFIQGYSEYDSKKSGGVTISHLRFNNSLIKAPYYTTTPELIIISKDEYFKKYDMISNIKENGILIINTRKNEEEINKFLPNNVKRTLTSKKIKTYIIDADDIAYKNAISGKISTIMQAAALNALKIPNYEEILIKTAEERFKSKGKDIIKSNVDSILESEDSLHEIKINNTKTYDLNISNDLFSMIDSREGNKLTVKEVLKNTDGHLPGGLSSLEKRKIAPVVSKWNNEKCIECGICTMVCPHAVIRQVLVDEDDKYADKGKDTKEPKKKFIITLSEADCTACGLCARECPMKCFYFDDFDPKNQEMADYLIKNNKSPQDESKTLRDIAFKKPHFEFSGACAGCGETSYIRLLTQLLGEKLVIANATGCSSIYGGSCPSTPYTVSWANSLFEDNAEFAFGMLQTYKKMNNRIENILLESKKEGAKNFHKKLIKAKDNYEETLLLKEEAKKYLPKDLVDYITPKSVWSIGGDGWAYDIGFGGIDHILSSGENVKILVLDTEVYSNTGGQSSKATRLGAVAQFANMGKRTQKKDMFKIAMSYPNVYIAEVSLGANMMQTVKALKEAEEHDGPAIVIAYSPCIEHGIKGGLTNTVQKQKLSVQSGYNILMRYKDEKLYIDSPKPNFDKYEEFLNSERRYTILKEKDEKLADKLLSEIKESAIKRYEYFEKLNTKE